MAPHRLPTPPACHPERPHFARGLCRPCYYDCLRVRVTACVDCGADITDRGAAARRCLGCVALKRNREQTAARPGKRAYFRSWNLATKYALTDDDDQALGTECHVCGKHPLLGNDRHIDHDHSAGRVRGVLCRRCNTGIGMLGDNLEGVLRAVEYLRK
jgi:hypothetical protein